MLNSVSFQAPAYFRPATVAAAVDALRTPGWRVLSGGTDVYPTADERLSRSRLLDISGLDELATVEVGPHEVRIGARATWSAVSKAPLPRCFAALQVAARQIGSVQIQNTGTVAGNLCTASPAADGVPPLLALDAAVELACAAGTRRLPLGNFIAGYRQTLLRPDELVVAIVVPRRLDKAASTFLKLGSRRYLVISIAMVAAVVATDPNGRVAEARIAVGACSAVAQRLAALEGELVGMPARPGLGGHAAPRHVAALAPIDDVRASADYRRHAALVLVRRALETVVGAA